MFWNNHLIYQIPSGFLSLAPLAHYNFPISFCISFPLFIPLILREESSVTVLAVVSSAKTLKQAC